MTDDQIKLEISALIEGLPGLDTRNALDRLGGNPSMYIGFIKKFYSEYNNSGERLSNFLAEKDLSEAHRLIHSIKSLAGNLGADELHQKAISLEKNMKRGKVMPSSAEVDLFQRELTLVLQEVNAFLLLRESRD